MVIEVIQIDLLDRRSIQLTTLGSGTMCMSSEITLVSRMIIGQFYSSKLEGLTVYRGIQEYRNRCHCRHCRRKGMRFPYRGILIESLVLGFAGSIVGLAFAYGHCGFWLPWRRRAFRGYMRSQSTFPLCFLV
jgi:hypothetical protein